MAKLRATILSGSLCRQSHTPFVGLDTEWRSRLPSIEQLARNTLWPKFRVRESQRISLRVPTTRLSATSAVSLAD